MRLLQVRTPYTEGKDVLEVQQLLTKAGYSPGPKDGVFGPRTGAACNNYKWDIGYQKGHCHPTAGGLLLRFLRGEKKPFTKMKIRAAMRKARSQEKGKRAKMRLKALAGVKAEIGTLEQPNHSNIIKYNTWWGWGAVAYCVIGVSWVWIVKCGSKAFKRGVRWANTDAMLADAKAGRNGLHLLAKPLPGSPGVIDFDGHSDPDHAITCISVDGDDVITGEFNTTKDGTNVEGVWKKRRALKNCWWFSVTR